MRPATYSGLLVAALAGLRPAAALTIIPAFDSSITGAADAEQVETAINDAIGTIDALYWNAGTVGIVFNQTSGNFLGETNTAAYALSYAAYTAAVTAVSGNESANSVLATAIANLPVGNKPGAGGSVIVTSADARVALGLPGFSGCFNSSGSYVSGCKQAFDGVITLSTSYLLNYGRTSVPGQYSAINALEHEINEVLGGGGQGSVLNQIAAGQSNHGNDVGVLDLYRYAAPGMASFSTSSGVSSYFSVDGGVTDIIGFNQNSTGDYADFSTTGDIQSAFSNTGNVLPYDDRSPEFTMMESIGYSGSVPEPASLAVLVPGIAGLGAMRRARSVQSPAFAKPKPADPDPAR